MNLSKVSNTFYSDDHDAYIIMLKVDFSYVIFKNAQTTEPMTIDEVPEELKTQMALELGRLNCRSRTKENQITIFV